MTEQNTNETRDLFEDEGYLANLITPLIRYHFDSKIVRTVDERGILLTLCLHPEDMGRIIGKQGETARAIRHLLRQYGLQNKARVALKINEPIKA